MNTSSSRRRLPRRRTLMIAALGALLVVLGTASVGAAQAGRHGAKRVELAGPRGTSKRVTKGGKTVPTTTQAPTTVPTTTVAPTSTSTTTTTTRPTTTAPPTTAARANGPTFYVAVNGNDANPGTAAAPWRSLSGAVSRLNPGDTLYLRGGKYAAASDEQFNIEGKNGNANAWITIAAYPGERPVVQLNSFWQGFYINNSSYVAIRGLEIVGTALTDQRMTSGIEINASHHVQISGNVVHDVGGCGVCAIASNQVRVEGNEVYGASKWDVFQTSGISFFQSANIGGGNNADGFSMYISGNRVHDNTNIAKPGPGLPVTDGNCVIIDYNDDNNFQGSTLIQNNLCYDNGGRGVEVTHSKNVLAINNTMVNDLRHPEIDGGEITVAWSSNIVYRNNLTSASRPGGGVMTWDSQVEMDHNVHVGQAPAQLGTADQVTASALNTDFTLAPNSAAINAGNPDQAPATDIRGVRRDAHPDIGAFEAT